MAVFRNPVSEVSLTTFANDVDKGLSSSNKYLSSKYFYDDEGSRLFQHIMDMPEYYLTRCEMEIFKQQAHSIYEALGFNEKFNIVELGAGDGVKTKEFLSCLHHFGVPFTFIPVDISEGAIEQITELISSSLPLLDVNPKVGDYFEVLEEIENEQGQNLFMLLGSNIGNYGPGEALSLLRMIYTHMKSGDMLLLGVDLKKDPDVVARAYRDEGEITKAFNLNLLHRINRELDADFDLGKFDFYSHYNPQSGEIRSYLISLCEQVVSIGYLNKSFGFKSHETIYSELSKKYDIDEIQDIAVKVGFDNHACFTDKKNYFADILLKK